MANGERRAPPRPCPPPPGRALRSARGASGPARLRRPSRLALCACCTSERWWRGTRGGVRHDASRAAARMRPLRLASRLAWSPICAPLPAWATGIAFAPPWERTDRPPSPTAPQPPTMAPQHPADDSAPLHAGRHDASHPPHALHGGEDLVEAAGLAPGHKDLLTEPDAAVAAALAHGDATADGPWTRQITVRSLVFGVALGVLFAIITAKLNLTAGIIPSLGMATTLLGYFCVTAWNKVVVRCGGTAKPFTQQENTMMQTFIGACAGASFSGGFGSYLLAMDRQSFLNVGAVPGNREEDVYDPVLTRTIPYMFCISFVGIFMLVNLRKRFIIDYDLPYPSGTAGGVLINSLHSLGGEADAAKQVTVLGRWGIVSLAWAGFKWFFSSEAGPACSGGFDRFPSLGLAALRWKWNFDFQLTYIGVGMICPHVVNLSMLAGAVLTWGFAWPMIDKRAGDWFPAGLKEKDFRGLYGYQVFLAIAVFMGDGLYNAVKILWVSGRAFAAQRRAAAELPSAAPNAPAVVAAVAARQAAAASARRAAGERLRLATSFRRPAKRVAATDAPEGPDVSGSSTPSSSTTPMGTDKPMPTADGKPAVSAAGLRARRRASTADSEAAVRRRDLDARRDAVFMRDAIPGWIGWAGYAAFGVLGVAVIPLLYPACRWYMVATAYAVAPAFCFANAYAAGLTDWDMASMYGKLCIFAFAAWGGVAGGGVIAGLAICGVVLSTTSAASGLMFDFKTGWITQSSPRAMFAAQTLGSAIGCLVGPLTFSLFYRAFPVGVEHSEYPAPYATIYRGMAILGTQGFGALPSHCLELFAALFAASFLLGLARDALPSRYAQFVPIPTAMGLPFYLGPNYAVGMCLGSAIKWAWERRDPEGADSTLVPAAAGLIIGEGLWSVPQAALAMGKVRPPICMTFSRAGAAVVEKVMAAAAPAAG